MYVFTLALMGSDVLLAYHWVGVGECPDYLRQIQVLEHYFGPSTRSAQPPVFEWNGRDSWCSMTFGSDLRLV